MAAMAAVGEAIFTCITCRVAFGEADAQRDHYRTDWHKYNLKRKVAELPPVTAENFTERELAQRSQAEAEDAVKHRVLHCETCGKQFKSEGAYENHMGSAKHKAALEKAAKRPAAEPKSKSKGANLTVEQLNRENARKSEVKAREDEEMHSVDDNASNAESWDEDDDALGVEECLFCETVSKDSESNVKHMTSVHSFFIPDLDYLVDLEGFISYLGEKVGAAKMCLWCGHSGKMFYSTKSVQQHMRDKGHTQVFHEGDAVYEYADFYDYTSSYPEGFEGDENDEVESVMLEEQDDFTLKLPSGATIGHRALRHFYRQNLAPHQGPTASQQKALRNVLAQHKALGWTGTTGQLSVQRAKNVAYVQRIVKKHRLKMGVKTNKFQPHFRPQVVF